MDTSNEKMLTPAQVAGIFSVDAKTVTRWAQAGKLTSIRTLGGHRRYMESEVRALLAGSVAERVTDPLAAPVHTLWTVGVSGAAATVMRRLPAEGITTVGKLVACDKKVLREMGFRSPQVDEGDRRPGLRRSGVELGGLQRGRRDRQRALPRRDGLGYQRLHGGEQGSVSGVYEVEQCHRVAAEVQHHARVTGEEAPGVRGDGGEVGFGVLAVVLKPVADVAERALMRRGYCGVRGCGWLGRLSHFLRFLPASLRFLRHAPVFLRARSLFPTVGTFPLSHSAPLSKPQVKHTFE